MKILEAAQATKPGRVVGYQKAIERSEAQRMDYNAAVEQMLRADFGKELIAQRERGGRSAKTARVIQSIKGFVQSEEFVKVIEGPTPPKDGHLWDLFIRQLLLNEVEIGADCWLAPYETRYFSNKLNKQAYQTIWRVSLKPEYWLRMAARDPNIARVQLGVVYEGDEFDLVLGSDPYLHHRPQVDVDNPARQPICAYVVIWGTASDKHPLAIEYLNKRQIRERKARSGTANKTDANGKPLKSPWANDEEAMLKAKAAGLLRRYITTDVLLPNIDTETAEKLRVAAHAHGLRDVSAVTDISDMEEYEEPAQLENNAPPPMETVVSTMETAKVTTDSKKELVENKDNINATEI